MRKRHILEGLLSRFNITLGQHVIVLYEKVMPILYYLYYPSLIQLLFSIISHDN